MEGTDLRLSRFVSRSALNRYALVAALAVPFIGYLWYISRYGVNALFADDWNLVPALDAGLHGHLALDVMWQQHNENRIFVPQVISVIFGRVDHFDAKSVMYFDALIFGGSYLIFVGLWRQWIGSPLAKIQILLIGLVWFSLEDYENALWAFEIEWYLVLALFLLMLWFLALRRLSYEAVVGAAIVGFLASFCQLQGLLLWPVGLLCILWRREDRSSLKWLSAIWLSASVVATVLYFYNFNFQLTGGNHGFSLALHHPLRFVKYMTTAVASVFPQSHPSLWHEMVGGLILVVGIVLGIQDLRARQGKRLPFVAAVVVFAILFDASIAIGRLDFGVSQALSPRYTMFNLILLIAVVIGLHRTISERRPTAHRRRFRDIGVAATAVISSILVVQVVVSGQFGIDHARVVRSSRLAGARGLVNLDNLPVDQRIQVVNSYVYPGYDFVLPLIRVASRDRLAEFSGARRHHRNNNMSLRP